MATWTGDAGDVVKGLMVGVDMVCVLVGGLAGNGRWAV